MQSHTDLQPTATQIIYSFLKGSLAHVRSPIREWSHFSSGCPLATCPWFSKITSFLYTRKQPQLDSGSLKERRDVRVGRTWPEEKERSSWGRGRGRIRSKCKYMYKIVKNNILLFESSTIRVMSPGEWGQVKIRHIPHSYLRAPIQTVNILW